MSPALLRRARRAYAGIGFSAGQARVFVRHLTAPSPHGRPGWARVDTGVIRGMSAQIAGP